MLEPRPSTCWKLLKRYPSYALSDTLRPRVAIRFRLIFSNRQASGIERPGHERLRVQFEKQFARRKLACNPSEMEMTAPVLMGKNENVVIVTTRAWKRGSIRSTQTGSKTIVRIISPLPQKGCPFLCGEYRPWSSSQKVQTERGRDSRQIRERRIGYRSESRTRVRRGCWKNALESSDNPRPMHKFTPIHKTFTHTSFLSHQRLETVRNLVATSPVDHEPLHQESSSLGRSSLSSKEVERVVH